MKRIDILGTKYTIKTRAIADDEILQRRHLAGYCDEDAKLIVIAEMPDKEHIEIDDSGIEHYKQKTLRHEIIHAFLSESGLSDSASYSDCWAKNEEAVDWLAIQSPKIFAAFREANCI